MKTLLGLNYAKAQTDEFQKAFGLLTNDKPTLLPQEEILIRAKFIAEELIELIGAVATNLGEMNDLTDDLTKSLYQAEQKQTEVGFDLTDEERLVAIIDALTDINYFTQGTFSMLGVEPQQFFDIVQRANMGKLGPDGKPIRRESDGKVMKPEGWAEKFAPEPLIKEELKKQINGGN